MNKEFRSSGCHTRMKASIVRGSYGDMPDERHPDSPRNYPGSCSQREPKSPKRDDARNANLRGVVCGTLAPASI
jgi:hypothetical protein